MPNAEFIERVEITLDYADGRPVADIATALVALVDVVSTELGDEDPTSLAVERAADGLTWLAALPAAMFARLIEAGHLRIKTPRFTLAAEWPTA